MPFELPQGWAWVKLNDLLSKIGAGSTPLGGKQVYVNDGVPFLRSQNVWNEGLRLDDVAYIKPETHQKMSGTHVSDGDLLFNITGASIGRCAIVPDSFDTGNVSQHVVIVRSISKEVLQFLHLVLISNHVQQTVMDVQVGVSREGLSIGKLGQFIIPIPPLAEQYRIVAKVDELMALCDQLETQHSNAAEAHEKLVNHLLSTLTQSPTSVSPLCKRGGGGDLDWQRIAEHFDTLFTTEASIDALKQTLLQLAVMGKLVPQDPNDEPASELLKRIQAEKAKLVSEGKVKQGKPLPLIKDEDKPFELPECWEWVRIGELVQSTDYGLSDKTFENPDGVPVLKMGDIQNGKVLLGGQKKLHKGVDGLPGLYLQSGDLLYNRTNSLELVGKTGIYEGPECEYTFASYLIRIRCVSGLLSPQYLNLVMNTPLFRETQIVPHLKQQCGQANVNGTILKNMIVNIPSLNEQNRIFAKVDELMALCDQLKSRITQAKQLQQKLADVLVEQAVSQKTCLLSVLPSW